METSCCWKSFCRFWHSGVPGQTWPPNTERAFLRGIMWCNTVNVQEDLHCCDMNANSENNACGGSHHAGKWRCQLNELTHVMLLPSEEVKRFFSADILLCFLPGEREFTNNPFWINSHHTAGLYLSFICLFSLFSVLDYGSLANSHLKSSHWTRRTEINDIHLYND